MTLKYGDGGQLETLQSDSYYVDLAKFGIKTGTLGSPPYTTPEWAQAYNNILGMNKALLYAKAQGFTRMVLPKATYSFCYTNLSGTDDPSGMVNVSIDMPSNMTWDLNGSVFEVIYDSHNKSPYDLSTVASAAWLVRGKLITMKKCHHSHITNGTIIGDLHHRSFDDGGSGFSSENGQEQTYGVFIDNGSTHCSVTHMTISMFMGDGVCLGANPDTTYGYIMFPEDEIQNTVSAGYFENNGTTTAQTGSYYTPAKAIDPTQFPLIQMRSGGGFTRIVGVANRAFQYVFQDASNVVVARKLSTYLQPVPVPYNATKVRIQFVKETGTFNKKFIVASPQPAYILIENCDISMCHRGGISGGADFTTIRRNRIYHNGMDSMIGAPVFPDSTRYQINFEDSYCDYLTVENNWFFSGFHGLLAGVFHLNCQGNIFNNVGGVVVYNNHVAYIRNNIFQRLAFDPLYLADHVSLLTDRMIYFTDNVVESHGFTVDCDETTFPTTSVKILNNRLILNTLVVKGDVDFTGNHVSTYDGTTHGIVAGEGYTSFLIDCIKNTNNTYEDISDGTGYRYSFSACKKSGTSAMVRGNTFKNSKLQGLDIANNIEFHDCEFYNCEVNSMIQNSASDSSLQFYGCQFYDTPITSRDTYVNNTTTSAKILIAMYRCKVVMTDAFPVNGLLRAAENKTENNGLRTYNIEMYDTDLVSTKLSAAYTLVGNAYGIGVNVNLKIDNCVLDIGTIAQFGLMPSSYPASLANVSRVIYRNFTTLPLPTGVTASVRSSSAATSLVNDFGPDIGFYSGTGSPNGVVAAKVGSTYFNLSGGAGTTMYVKESGTGNTGWVGK